ncbi:MAG: malonyl-ACP O-methyltransferase BioC [Gammaproteobacteria bacterium]|nr:malonyl-ACP O-methyltransferase BioC [Gammaproteobacteria bacterium]
MKQFDLQAMLRGFNRHHKAESKLTNQIAEGLIERCQMIKQQPQTIVDLGCGTGEASYRLSKIYPKAKVTGIDIAEQRLKAARKKRPWFNKTIFIEANIQSLPLADNSVDLIFSNLCLYWVEDLNQAFKEIQRVLKTDGILLFSSLGPDTLQELRHSFAEVDDKPHVNIFLDMHEIGDAMQKAGLKDPVMDVDYIKQSHPSLQSLAKLLKTSGESNYHSDRALNLMGKQKWQKAKEHYETYRNSFGKLPATYEVVYGYALGSANFAQLNNQGEVCIPISQIGRKAQLI